MRARVIGFIGTSVALLGLTLAGASSASAAEPTAGCGAGHTLIRITDAVHLVDWRFLGGADVPPSDAADYLTPADRNGDDWVCIKQYKPNQGRDKHYGGVEGYVVTLVLDNRALGRG